MSSHVDTSLFSQFPTMTSEQLGMVFREAKTARLKKKEILVHQGQENHSVFWLIRGQVKIFVVDFAGKESLLSLGSPNSLFFEMEAFSDLPASYSVQAMEECELKALEASAFLQSLIDCRLLNEYFSVFSKKNAITTVRHSIIAFNSKKDLIRYYACSGMTHQQIADSLGCSREYVSKVINDAYSR